MTWTDKFNKVRDIVENEYGIEVNLFDEIPKRLYQDPDIDIPYNGTTFLDQEYPTIIDIYGNIDKYPMELTCVLIHEFGHVLANNCLGEAHTEKDAWLFGMNFFKEDLVPPIISDMMKKCLATYNE